MDDDSESPPLTFRAFSRWLEEELRQPSIDGSALLRDVVDHDEFRLYLLVGHLDEVTRKHLAPSLSSAFEALTVRGLHLHSLEVPSGPPVESPVIAPRVSTPSLIGLDS